MPTFSATSQNRLNTCHVDIRIIMNEVIRIYDCSILEGLRTDEKQAEYYHLGKSQLDGINKKSKHQDDGSGYSRAVDIMPYKRGTNAFSGNEKDNRRFYFMMGIVKAVATRLLAEGRITHKVRFGMDWDSDDVYTDQNFDDMPHFSIYDPKNDNGYG